MSKYFDTYQEGTHKTAIYPEDQALAYLTLGFASEISEFGNAETKELAIAELGDLFWFTAELANLINASLSALFHANRGQNYLDEGWNIPPGDAHAMAVLSQELFDVMGPCAKHIRDGSPYREEMYLFLARTIQTLDSVCDVMGIETDQVMKDNLEKLQSRKDRGKLGGSGDKR